MYMISIEAQLCLRTEAALLVCLKIAVDMLICRSKLSMAQSSANKCEAECSSLQEDNASLSCQLARCQGQLGVTQVKLRWVFISWFFVVSLK